MLAYVFWHRRKDELSSRENYEEKLRLFHESLNSADLVGFEGSIVARIHDAPWFNPKGSEGYEDWYLLDNSETMDRLNDVAVSNSRKEPHDDVAHLATDFRGGLYQLRTGSVSSPSSISHGYTLWFSKPPGTSYEHFYDRLSKFPSRERTSLWRRFMVLGPTPEFCIISPTRLELPSQYNPNQIEREIVWRSPRAPEIV